MAQTAFLHFSLCTRGPPRRGGRGRSAAASRDPAKLKRHLAEAVAGFGVARRDDMSANLKKALNPFQQSYVDKWLAVTDWRMKWLQDSDNFDAMVSHIAQSGGIK